MAFFFSNKLPFLYRERKKKKRDGFIYVEKNEAKY